MANERIITGIDIGNHSIKTVISIYDIDKKEIHIMGVGKSPSNGLRKGVIVDAEEVVSNITSSLEEAERMSGIPVNHVFIGVGGSHIESVSSKGIIATGKKEISESDIFRVIEAAESVAIPPNKTRLKTIPKNFSVDSQGFIKNPIGLSGLRLEVDAHIISGQKQVIENIEKVVQRSGVDINDIIPNILANSESTLERRQKELGVLLLDIGMDETSIMVFEESSIVHSSTIPIGGNTVTSDIAIGLRVSLDVAENLKIKFGSAIINDKNDEKINLSMVSKKEFHDISSLLLAEIISARYHEIFNLVNKELRKIGKDGMLAAGGVLTGSGSKMNGVSEIAREVLNLPVQIGVPQNIYGMTEKIDDPSFASAVGLTVWGSKNDTVSYGIKIPSISKLFSSAGSLFKKIMP